MATERLRNEKRRSRRIESVRKERKDEQEKSVMAASVMP